MDQAFEYSGIWWLPQEPGMKASGNLTYSPYSHAELKLIGSLTPNEPIPLSRSSFPVVHGLTVDGKRVTLFNCLIAGSTWSSPGMPVVRLRPSFTLVGAHFEDPLEANIEMVTMHFHHLDQWISAKSIIVDDRTRNTEDIKVNIDKAPPVELFLDGYTLTFRTKLTHSGDEVTHFNISQKAWIDIKPYQPMQIGDLPEVIRHLQRFLSFLIGKPTYPTKIFCKSSRNVMSFQNEVKYVPPVDFYYELPMDIPLRLDALDARDMLLPLSSIRGKLELFAKNWLIAERDMSAVLNQYFAVVFPKGLYLEQSFLLLVQALETYHRKRFGGQYQNSEDYQKGIYKKLVDALPSDLDKAWRDSLIRGRLFYANEYSMRKRLTALLRFVTEKATLSFWETGQNIGEFVDTVVDTRNFLIHSSDELKPMSAQGENLYRIKEKCRLLLEICLVLDLGIDELDLPKFVEHRLSNLFT